MKQPTPPTEPMTAGATPSLPAEMAPSRYIEKVDLATGDVLEPDFEPRRLLIHSHRDYHLVDIQARFMMSRVIKATGDEEAARQKMKEMRRLGHRTSQMLARMIGQRDPKRLARALFGLKDREYYFRYKRHHMSADDIRERVEALQSEARKQLDANRGETGLQLRFLLTGGTGFVGKEVLWQAAHDPAIAECVVVIRPKVIRDRKSGEVLETLSPSERGQRLLRELWLDDHPATEKFRFIGGDVEEPGLGISQEDLTTLQSSLTHVIHCAASVAFDDPYEKSFRANVNGTLNALRFSFALQSESGSPFVAHIGIETSYIHGRQTKDLALEDEIVFPRNFYNNYYELTKAMGSIETERFMLEKGLRVAQLCPAIVIGESRAGNNRGDTKVVNAPVNVFGRARQALAKTGSGWRDRSKAAAIARLACIFPGDPSAQINLITVDRVAAGILASLKKWEAVSERVHLASDTRIRSHQIRTIVAEELDIDVKLAEPTLHRNVTLPLLTRVLTRVGQKRTATALEKLGSIFSGYSEWGQPIHEVGKDVEILGLSSDRPDAAHCFRMLCRHNKWVQNFGQLKDPDEISRREKIWWDLMLEIEREFDQPAGALSGTQFRSHVETSLDPDSFTRRQGP